MVETWEKKEKVGKSRLVLEEFALHTGKIGDATMLTGAGTNTMVIHWEGRWSSNAFMMCVRANMEDPRWVSEVLSEESGSKRQPDQGTTWV